MRLSRPQDRGREPFRKLPAEILRDIANRVLIAVPTLLLVSVFVFLLQKLLPGRSDPAAGRRKP
ncbi:hypothetical protein [Halodurantibacterium flavum]|uniref:ABC transporter permease n=1 Tax=Halodurantibacterium flavum TaxID=1382802 RepID=A0ABW4S0Y3_9RHOB